MMMDTPIERMNQTVTLVSATPDAEKHMAYCARVTILIIRKTKSFWTSRIV